MSSNNEKCHKKYATLSILSLSLSLAISSAYANGERFTKEKIINGKTVVFEKTIYSDHEKTSIKDLTGKPIKQLKLESTDTIQLGPQLKNQLKLLKSDDKLWVWLVNKAKPQTTIEKPLRLEAEIFENDYTKLIVNGRKVNPDQYAKKIKQQQAILAKKQSFEPQDNYSEIKSQLLSKKVILSLIKNPPENLMGIEVMTENNNDMSTAIVETGVDPWAFFPWRSKGAGTRVYISEAGHCIDDDTHFIPGYHAARNVTESTTLAEHAIKTTSVFHTVSPHANVHCGGGGILAMPTNPSIYDAISASQSSQLYGSYSANEKSKDNFVYTHDKAFFQAAGNDGDFEQFVKSPGNALNVITVGNYDHKSGAPTINPRSGWKDGQTGINKPEIVAPGTNLDIQGIGQTFFGRNGTSYSTPHAAGFYTNFIGDEPWFKGSAALAKAYMISHATIDVNGGKDKTGEGGIHYRKAGGNIYRFNESNSKWNDITNDGNYLTIPIAVNWSREKAKVAIAWLTRGDYTYAHRNDAHPIGMDFDMRVIDADGNYVCGSASWDNTYEACSWTLPDTSTSYRVRVNRYANRDTSARIKLAIVSHSFNDE